MMRNVQNRYLLMIGETEEYCNAVLLNPVLDIKNEKSGNAQIRYVSREGRDILSVSHKKGHLLATDSEYDGCNSCSLVVLPPREPKCLTKYIFDKYNVSSEVAHIYKNVISEQLNHLKTHRTKDNCNYIDVLPHEDEDKLSTIKQFITDGVVKTVVYSVDNICFCENCGQSSCIEYKHYIYEGDSNKSLSALYRQYRQYLKDKIITHDGSASWWKSLEDISDLVLKNELVKNIIT